jgi:hypothetical protein
VQAEILAQYKPTIDKKTLITELKRSDKLASDALVNFKNTRHVVLYYEDVVRNRTVSRCCSVALYRSVEAKTISILLTSVLFLSSDAHGCPGFSKSAKEETVQSTCENPH